MPRQEVNTHHGRNWLGEDTVNPWQWRQAYVHGKFGDVRSGSFATEQVLNNVRYASDSDRSRYESELTLWAINGLMHCNMIGEVLGVPYFGVHVCRLQ
jgi:hypothetical protein